MTSISRPMALGVFDIPVPLGTKGVFRYFVTMHAHMDYDHIV